MDDLISEFLAETRDMLQALSGAIVAWEASPSDRARLDEIFRFVHTVKGNCGFFDLPRLSSLSHAAEDALAEVRAGKREADSVLVTAVLAVIDRIGELVQALESGEPIGSEGDQPLIAALSGAAFLHSHPEPPVERAGGKGKAMRSIRLPVDRLDQMMSGVSDAVLARNELARRLRERGRDPELEAAFERVSACIGEIREAITRTRMQRIDSLFSALPRMVRDLSSELQKEVRLEVDGGDVELDREMIEMIRDPLTQIIRNAIDHGIEAPDERMTLGKARAGVLRIAARQSGNQILIEVADDGRGMDGEALVRKALASGTLTLDQAERLSPQQKMRLAFAPGLSTAGKVTAISGRGVGMDVVRANIERIGGVIDIDSLAGQGVRLCIRVPLTLTIIPALTVSSGGQTFAIPRSAIEEILRIGPHVRVDQVGQAFIATVRGRRHPLVDLSSMLEVDRRSAMADRRLILLKPAGNGLFALFVDAVHDHEELVVKPAAPAIMAAGLYAGTTLADDGRPILLLDPSGIAREAGLDQDLPTSLVEEADRSPRHGVGTQSTLLLFRSLDGAMRAVPVALVERIEDVKAPAVRFTGGRLRVAIGDCLLPLAGCPEAPSAGKLRLLRLTDGDEELAYAFSEVIDIRPMTLEARPPARPGEIAGVALVDGEPVELIDVHWLFAEHLPARSAPQAAPTCSMPSGDPWFENMLRPLVESLGYRVVEDGEGGKADVRIVRAEDEPGTLPVPSEGAAIVRVRTRSDGGEPGHSVYRYDRQGLIDALRTGMEGVRHG